MVQFADGSTTRLLGKVDVGIKIGTETSHHYMRCFFVLEDLTCDILLEEVFFDDTKAFDTYSSAFELDQEDDGLCEVYDIV